jgi:hypothetical protein
MMKFKDNRDALGGIYEGGGAMIDRDLLADLLEYLRDRCAQIRGDLNRCPMCRFVPPEGRCCYADSRRCETWDFIERLKTAIQKGTSDD